MGIGIAGLILAPSAHADFFVGLQKIIAGIFAVPLQTLAGTFNGPPLLGTLGGALSGAFNGIGLVLNGTLEVAASAVPIAKTVAPYLIPIFL